MFQNGPRRTRRDSDVSIRLDPPRARSGRLGVIEKLMIPGKFTLNVGSKKTEIGDIRVDIDRSVRPDVVCDAAYLPFRSECFEQVVFADVIEHLKSSRKEVRALKELFRVLKKDGILILSTPNRPFLYMLMDPAFYLTLHWHYSSKHIRQTLTKTGFKIGLLFTAGYVWASFANFFHNRWLLRFLPAWLGEKAQDEYLRNYGKQGYTIFTRAMKTQRALC